MGSFSVACGMSNIPITGGEQVLFLPLKQNRYLSNIPKEHFFCYSDDLYEPALLPIEGTYNTYGSIDNIVKNEHTSYLEQKFNNSIEFILETITRGKRDLFSIWDTKLSSSWGLSIYKENSLDTFFNLGFKFIEKEYSSCLYLEKYDLYITSLNQDEEDFHFLINNSYIIKNNFKSFKFNFNKGTSLQEFIFLNFNILLGLEDEKNMQSIIDLFSMGGQFFLKSIFDDMSSISFSEYKMNVVSSVNSFNFPVSNLHLLDLGFIKQEDNSYQFNNIIVKDTNFSICVVSFNNKLYKFFSLKEFLSFFYKKNISFDQSKLLKYTFFKTKLLELQSLILNEDFEEISKLKEQYILDGKDFSALDRVLKRSSYSLIERHIFGSNSSFLSENYMDYFYNIISNFDLNKDYFILDLYSSFSRFKSSMVATNHLFIPSFCGYQEGAIHVNKYLAKLTLKTINNKG